MVPNAHAPRALSHALPAEAGAERLVRLARAGRPAPALVVRAVPRPNRVRDDTYVKRASGIALGILAGIGGFVDMGGVITSSQAGAIYRYALLWTVIPGIIGFAVYADMSGRIAISTGRATFDIVRDRLGGRLALLPFAATVFVDVLTLAVEMGRRCCTSTSAPPRPSPHTCSWPSRCSAPT